MALRFGLRARVAANLAAAVSITFGLLALSMMAIVQDNLRQTGEDGVEQLADVAAAEAAACVDEGCRGAIQRRYAGSGATVTCLGWATASTRIAAGDEREPRIEVERPAGAGGVRVTVPLAGLQQRSQDAKSRLLVFLALDALALIVIGTLLFERGVVRRLGLVDEAMARVEKLDLETPLLVEEGDEIGRLGGTVRRMVERLREEKTRREAYIAELERTNRELKETREGLVRSEKLATVGRLAAGVAHEIGNPVAAVLGYVDVIRMRKETPSEEYIERIERETRRIDRIVRDLLEFARPAPLVPGPVDVKAIVESVARLVVPQPKWREMKLELAIDPGLPAAMAQEHYATQVLLNLLMNAADACEGRGTARVAARRVDGQIEVEVADDGPGIPPEHLARLFDPFFTTKAPGAGTGLGLAIAHRLMESFGGSIAARNGAKGAIFTLRFRTAA